MSEIMRRTYPQSRKLVSVHNFIQDLLVAEKEGYRYAELYTWILFRLGISEYLKWVGGIYVKLL